MKTLGILSSELLSHDRLFNDPEIREAIAIILAGVAQSLGAEVQPKDQSKEEDPPCWMTVRAKEE